MITWALKKILGTSHEREVKRLRPQGCEAINALEPTIISKLSDAELRRQDRSSSSTKLDNGAKLDDILHRGVRRVPRGRANAPSRCATTTCSSSAG